MFSDAEMKLLTSPHGGFPLLAAVQSTWRSCRTCGHANVNIHSMLRVALTRYRSDKKFIAHCKSLFPLPCSVAGVLLEE